MKIVLTVHQFLPEFSAGTEILTYETAKELRKNGHDISVVTGFPSALQLKDSERFDRYIYDGISVERFHHSYVPMGNQVNILEMEYDNCLFGSFFRRYLKRKKPDVVHFFHLSRLSASPIDICRELRIPTLLTPTDFWFICPASQLRLPHNRPCEGPDKLGLNCMRHLAATYQSNGMSIVFQKLPKWLIALPISIIKKGVNFDRYYSPMIRAISRRRDFLVQRINYIDQVVIPTQIMLSLLTRNGLEKQRITFMPYGLNLDFIQGSKRASLSHILRLGFIGSIAEHKGVHVLVEAMQKLTRRPVELKIYGEMDVSREYTRNLIKMSSGYPMIKFCGTFPNVKIGEIFSSMDALIVPSLWHENSPLVIYAAQAAGCPVVASNMAGISEIIEHEKNGLLFEAGDPSQLAAAIETLLNNGGLLQKLSSNAKRPLSIQDYVTKLTEIYSGLIRRL
jgi:glycosyltransferase involved in cell wall biosynthesis